MAARGLFENNNTLLGIGCYNVSSEEEVLIVF
jgi:hypothetical protein